MYVVKCKKVECLNPESLKISKIGLGLEGLRVLALARAYSSSSLHLVYVVFSWYYLY